MKIVVLLTVLYHMSLIADAAVHRTPIKKIVSIRQQLFRTGRLKEYNRVVQPLLRETGRLQIFEYMDNVLVIDVSIGSPPQQFQIIPDTGSSDLWVISTDCKNDSCKADEYKKNQFNASESSTYANYGQTFSLRYSSGHASGALGTDKVSFGGITIDKQVFGLATEISHSFDRLPMDGVMGLAWPALSSFKVTPPMQAILDDLDFPMMTIYMNGYVEPSTEKVEVGAITLGNFDFDNCYSRINWVQLTSQTFWQFTIRGVSIESYQSNGWQQAISDSGTSYLQIPAHLMKPIIRNINATFSFEYEVYIIDCMMQQSDHIIKINIGDTYYAISPDQYIRKYINDAGEELCVFAAFENFGVGFSPSWILGEVFLRSYCHVYDFANDRIGFALNH